jgi:hypothetical protein
MKTPAIPRFLPFTSSTIKMAHAFDRFVWTAGGNTALMHKRKIDVGASGSVHEVRYPATQRDKADKCARCTIAVRERFIKWDLHADVSNRYS